GAMQKAKLFLFGREEFWRFRTTVLKTSIVPTAAFKTGVFTFNGQPVDVTQGSPENIFGLPFDPTVQSILALYPNPNGTILDGARGLLHYPSHSRANANNVTGRIDHDFSEQATLSIRYTYHQDSDSNYPP